MTKEWKGVTGGSVLGQRSILMLLRFAHVAVGYLILAVVVPFYMLFARDGYFAIYRYFRRQFLYPPFKAFCKTYHNHFVFGQCMLDRFAVYAGKRNFFSMNITGNDEFYRLLDGEKGFIIASSHVGNFELSGSLLRQDKKHIYALAFEGETREVMENRVKVLGKNNISLIPVGNGMSHVFAVNEALSSGQIVSMSCDRVDAKARNITCDFLQGRAVFPLGAFALAVHFDVPVVSIFVMKESLSEYSVYVKILTPDGLTTASQREKSELLACKFVKNVEDIVRKYPEQWFNFYDFWKQY